MIEITREEFKTDEVWNMLFQYIKSHHRVAKHTERTLRKNRHIKDFCEMAEHFAVIAKEGKNDYFISYDVSSWWKDPEGVRIKFDRIVVYDNQDEYERVRRKSLNSTPHADDISRN